jgi:hypothetical protein
MTCEEKRGWKGWIVEDLFSFFPTRKELAGLNAVFFLLLLFGKEINVQLERGKNPNLLANQTTLI